MTPGLSVKQTNEILNRQSQSNQPNSAVDPFKGRTLIRSRGNPSALQQKPTKLESEPEQEVTYANISVQYDYLNPLENCKYLPTYLLTYPKGIRVSLVFHFKISHFRNTFKHAF